MKGNFLPWSSTNWEVVGRGADDLHDNLPNMRKNETQSSLSVWYMPSILFIISYLGIIGYIRACITALTLKKREMGVQRASCSMSQSYNPEEMTSSSGQSDSKAHDYTIPPDK